MIDLATRLREQNIRPRGVIHVGAHEGEDLGVYRAMGFGRILMVEANPRLLPRLRQLAARVPGTTVAGVAISDACGKARLKLTNSDQSSSLLPLKEPREAYPQIAVAEEIEVRTCTLDRLLEELRLDPADFNVLHLDIQGAEFMALQGAARVLKHIEAINTEVNFVELYEGGALFGQLEEFLGSQGFNRLDLDCPYHPSWGDALYLRRPLLTMSSLRSTGNFGDQLFQYVYVRLAAKEQGCIAQVPSWSGRVLFGLQDQAPTRTVAELTEERIGRPEGLLSGVPFLRDDADLRGRFQIHSSRLAPHRDFICRLLTPVPKIGGAVSHIVAKLRDGKRPLVALHVPSAEEAGPGGVPPLAWYARWLEERTKALPSASVYVWTDRPAEVLPALSRWDPLCFTHLRGFPPQVREFVDFCILGQADVAAISNTSISFMAALLNNRARAFARPSFEAGGLVSFDPWNAPVTLPQPMGDRPAKELPFEGALADAG